MRRFVSLSLAVTGLLVAAPALAVTKQDDVTATVHKKGQQGSQLIYKGTVKSKAFGKGTVVEKVYGSTLKGSFVITYKKGKIKGTSTAKLGSVSGPKIKVTGTYRITGGTGPYKNARGSGKFTGTSTRDLQTATFHQKGKVSY
jgi:hypothetical protein